MRIKPLPKFCPSRCSIFCPIAVPQIQPGDQENIIFNVEGTEHLAAKVKITNANKVFITFNNISSFPSGKSLSKFEFVLFQFWAWHARS